MVLVLQLLSILLLHICEGELRKLQLFLALLDFLPQLVDFRHLLLLDVVQSVDYFLVVFALNLQFFKLSLHRHEILLELGLLKGQSLVILRLRFFGLPQLADLLLEVIFHLDELVDLISLLVRLFAAAGGCQHFDFLFQVGYFLALRAHCLFGLLLLLEQPARLFIESLVRALELLVELVLQFQNFLLQICIRRLRLLQFGIQLGLSQQVLIP